MAKYYYKDSNAPKPNQPLRIGVIAIIKKENHFLLEQRTDCKKWGFIGGSLGINETVEESIIREIKEETGLNLNNLDFFDFVDEPSIRNVYPDGNIVRPIIFIYKIELEEFDNVQKSNESLAIKFVHKSDLTKLDIVEMHIPVVEKILKFFHS
ncbi:MAG: NUDIX domain-containing protein [Promethearchaeota archaeon]